jgi:hypothetical protein
MTEGIDECDPDRDLAFAIENCDRWEFRKAVARKHKARAAALGSPICGASRTNSITAEIRCPTARPRRAWPPNQRPGRRPETPPITSSIDPGELDE